MGSYSSNWVFKVLLVGFCWLLLVGLMISTSSCGGRSRSRALLMGRTSRMHHEQVVLGKEKKEQKEQKELVYNPELSKRRVPNGPDPIHNRKRPPGQT